MNPGDEFYRLPSELQTAALAELASSALPEFGIASDAEMALVTERENAVFRVEARDGVYAVRVHRAGYHTDAELRSHAAWARALAEEGVVATAATVPTIRGDVLAHAWHPDVPEPRQVTVLRWVEGSRLADSDTPEPEQYLHIGALMAALHEHASRWAAPPWFEVLRWDIDGLLGENPTWGPFWDSELVDDEGRQLLQRFREHARHHLQDLGTGPDRFGLVHGDFLPENLLIGPDETITLLDFDDAGYGWFMFDVATALVVPSMGSQAATTLEQFVQGYRSIRPLPEEDLSDLPLFLALRGATYVGWMHTRAHTQFAQDMGEMVAAATVEAVREVLEG